MAAELRFRQEEIVELSSDELADRHIRARSAPARSCSKSAEAVVVVDRFLGLICGHPAACCPRKRKMR